MSALTVAAVKDGWLLSTLVFEPSDYAQAVANYMACKEWALNNGLCFRGDVEGLIHSPILPGRDEREGSGLTVSAAVADMPGWVQRMTVGYRWEARAGLQKMELPEGAHWEGDLAENGKDGKE